MRISINSIHRTGVTALAVVLLGLTGCRSTPDRTAGQMLNDSSTSRQVKKALDQAPVFKYPDVRVAAFDGNVQLTGFVETEEQRTRAADIAANVRGVRQVINEIMIKPTPAGRATIRDPLGHETGRALLDTNSPPPAPLRMQPSQPSQPAQPAPAPQSPSESPTTSPSASPQPDQENSNR